MMLRMNPSKKKSKNSSMSARIAATIMLYWRLVIGRWSICSKVTAPLMTTPILYPSSTATARIGEPVPPRTRRGNPTKVNLLPTSWSRFARFS